VRVAAVLAVPVAVELGGLAVTVPVGVVVLAGAAPRCSPSPRSSRTGCSRARLRALGPSHGAPVGDAPTAAILDYARHGWIASRHVARARVASDAPVLAALDQTPGEVLN
jgi:hypothetical protein